jgi:hypothetical protein
MRRPAVTLALLASLVLAGCGGAELSKPGESNGPVALGRLGVRACREHKGLQQVIYTEHSSDAAIICRDGTVVPAHET